MAKFRSASRRISTTGSGWRHSQKAAAISATSAIEKNKTMKPLSKQSSVCQYQGHNPDGNVDEEDPAPTPIVGDPTPEGRANHRGSDDGHAVESESRGPLLRRERVHENGLLHGSKATAADALRDAKEDEQA